MIPASGYGQDSGDSDVKIELEGAEVEVAEKLKVRILFDQKGEHFKQGDYYF